MELDTLRKRLEPTGLDLEAVLEHGAQPAIAHAQALGLPSSPFLDALARYLEALAPLGVSAWSVTHFVSTPLLQVAGSDATSYDSLLQRTGALLTLLYRGGKSTTRTEQYGVRLAAAALKTPRPMTLALETSIALAGHDSDPGWVLQLAVPALWNSAEQNVEVFERLLRGVESTGVALAARGVHLGYPFATGLTALAGSPGATTHWSRWLEACAGLAGALSPRDVYGLFEHSLPGLVTMGLTPDAVLTALSVALTVADRGHDPRPTLAKGFTSPLAIELAAQLADAGLDPYSVVTSALPVFQELGLADDDGARLFALARTLHSHGFTGRQFFEDGVGMVQALERDLGGLGTRAVELAEAMAARGLDPGLTFAWGLPRACDQAFRYGFLPAKSLELARRVTDLGVDPEAALRYAVRPLAELADGDLSQFGVLTDALVGLISALQQLGVDHREVLFHDVARLAESGSQSQAFVELLRRLERLLAQWAGSGLDVQTLVATALPAAAREAVGRPWVLAAAFDAAERMAASGRGAEALHLLESGLGAATSAAAGDEAVFRQSFAAIERRYASLPVALSGFAASAACAIAGTDVTRLEASLDEISKRVGSFERAPELIEALPALAKSSDGPSSFGELIDVAVHTSEQVPPALRASWAANGLRAVATVAMGKPALAGRLISELASGPRAWGDDAKWVLNIVVQVASAGGSDLPALLSRLVALRRDTAAPDAVLPTVISVVCMARDETTASTMLASLGAALTSVEHRRPLLEGLSNVKSLLGRSSAWEKLIEPTLRTHRQHAGPLLSAFGALGARFLHEDSDLDVLRQVVTQLGVRALDAVLNLILPAMYSRVLPSLTAHRELLSRYLREVGLHDAQIYARYVEIQQEGALSETQRRAKSAALRTELEALTASIRAANVTTEDERNPLFFVALQYLFPSSVSSSRETYEDLYRRMGDRPQDLSQWNPGDALRRGPVGIASGSWQLRQGRAVDRTPWALLCEILSAPPPSKDPLLVIGWALLAAWSEGRLAQRLVKTTLISQLLHQVGSAGQGELALDSASQLLSLRDLAADRLHGLVEEALLAAKANDAARYQRLVRGKLAPRARVGPGLVKGVTKTLEALRAQQLNEAVLVERLRGQLQAFVVTDHDLETLRHCTTRESLTAALETLTPGEVELEAAKEIDRIHQELIGQELAAMQRVLADALEYRASSSVTELVFEPTKRRAHAAVGLTEGVCVARDEQLWNRPDFVQVIFWGPQGTALGGMHLLIVEERGRRYLSLPGVNPTLDLLEVIDANAFVDAALSYAWSLARHWGLAGVWIPTNPGIHSNRRAVHEAFVAKQFAARPTHEHQFSFSPYAYRFSEVWEVPQPVAPR